ncbi:hypothetical protein Slin15195_G077060 [Septoria linicola]|uniref:F-box domain-containing protein n=1 Tax=Septoria linicola TaxID=215465 RepID=A0A9Q9AYV0_9PEZI|nr:hypothetical protein Slin14017_G038230 [Septoria linicola]USW54387.1 hypothetical protein Slin15195_G077060 [Septoria linicola]
MKSQDIRTISLEKAMAAPVQPNQPPPLSAAQRVLGITELLENVLANLTMEKLFVIQRVNQKCKATIAGSLQLRTIMRLELLEAKPHEFCFSSGCGQKDCFQRHGLRRAHGQSWFSSTSVRKALETIGCRPRRAAWSYVHRGHETMVFTFAFTLCPATASKGSWQKIKAGYKGYRVSLDYCDAYSLPSELGPLGDECTLGDLVDLMHKREKAFPKY